MVLVATAAALTVKKASDKKKNTGASDANAAIQTNNANSPETDNSPDATIHALIGLILTITAVCLAVTANKNNTGVKNPVFMGIVAFLFSDIYLLQAGIRAAMGQWHLHP